MGNQRNFWQMGTSFLEMALVIGSLALSGVLLLKMERYFDKYYKKEMDRFEREWKREKTTFLNF